MMSMVIGAQRNGKEWKDDAVLWNAACWWFGILASWSARRIVLSGAEGAGMTDLEQTIRRLQRRARAFQRMGMILCAWNLRLRIARLRLQIEKTR